MNVINFGSCNIDYVYRVPHFVHPGETLSAIERNCFPGGKGLNQSLAIARSGVKVYHAGCIGTDGLFLKNILEDSGVNTQYLKVLDTASGHAIIQVDEKGENSIILHSGANDRIDPPFIDKVLANFGAGDLIVLQNEISNLSYIIDRAYEKGMKIVFNPAPFDPSLKKIDLNKISILILNQVEAAGFTGETVTEKICAYFTEHHPDLNVALTLGSKGSVLIDHGSESFCPSYVVKVKDTTSAGDTYMGYFISGLIRGYDPQKTLKFATAAAALAVSKHGAAVSIPYADEVTAALKILKPTGSENLELTRKKMLTLQYIESHLTDASLEELSSHLGYTKSHTTVWIKTHLNSSFSGLLKTCRCNMAAKLLRETDFPIDEIITRVGYENGSFFRGIFKESFGKSPLEYRKFYRKIN